MHCWIGLSLERPSNGTILGTQCKGCFGWIAMLWGWDKITVKFPPALVVVFAGGRKSCYHQVKQTMLIQYSHLSNLCFLRNAKLHLWCSFACIVEMKCYKKLILKLLLWRFESTCKAGLLNNCLEWNYCFILSQTNDLILVGIERSSDKIDIQMNEALSSYLLWGWWIWLPDLIQPSKWIP